MDHSDEELVGRICNGEEAALVLLMRRYHVNLCQYAHPLLGRHDLAREAAANVFVGIWQRRQKLAITGSVRSYLFSAVCKQAINLLASQGRRNNVVSIDDVPPHQLVEARKVDDELLYSELESEISSLLASMPPQRQLIFKMNRIENRRYKEIASILGISEHTVQNHMVKAVRQIEATLPRLRGMLRGDSPAAKNKPI